MPGRLLRVHAGIVSCVAAVIVLRIAIEDFLVPTGLRDAESHLVTHDGSEIADNHEEVVGIFGAANKAKQAIVAVVAIDPFEAVVFEILLKQSGFSPEHGVQIGDEALHA